MTVPRRGGWWMLILGSVGCVLGGAFALAWWKLPSWKPYSVIQHSPWFDPVLRAQLQDSNFIDPARTLDFAPSCGAALQRAFRDGSPEQRVKILEIACSLLTDSQEITDPLDATQVFRERSDGSRLTSAEASRLREYLVGLVDQAIADGAHYLQQGVARVARCIPEQRWTSTFCRWVKETPLEEWQRVEVLMAIAQGGDPVAVPHLIPLLATASEPGHVSYALNKCLAPTQSREVLAAATDEHWRLRAWAAEVLLRFEDDAALRQRFSESARDPVVEVRQAVVEALRERSLPEEWHHLMREFLVDPSEQIRRYATQSLADHQYPLPLRPALLRCLTDESSEIRLRVVQAVAATQWTEASTVLVAHLEREAEPFLRREIIETLAHLDYPGLHEVLRRLARTVDDPARGVAIIALGQRRDLADYPLLLELLSEEDDNIARKARIALGRLPLGPSALAEVDRLWREQQGTEEQPVTSPAAPPVP